MTDLPLPVSLSVSPINKKSTSVFKAESNTNSSVDEQMKKTWHIRTLRTITQPGKDRDLDNTNAAGFHSSEGSEADKWIETESRTGAARGCGLLTGKLLNEFQLSKIKALRRWLHRRRAPTQ